MKTNEEIQREALALTHAARAFRDESRDQVEPTPLPRVLVTLPDVRQNHYPLLEPRTAVVHTLVRERRVELAVRRGTVVYQLVEREVELDSSGRTTRDTVGIPVFTSHSADEVLQEAYRAVEADELGERLRPQLEESETRAPDEDAPEESVNLVMEAAQAQDLPSADRLRTRLEAGEFLVGRLEAGDFIGRVIERHRTRESQQLRESQREIQVRTTELRLSVGEA